MTRLPPLIALVALHGLLPGTTFAQEEVPFVTTPDKVTLAMLELAGVGPKDRLLDLGSGDGRIVINAAKRHGATATGVEIVPELVERSRASAQAAGVSSRVQFLEQDLFKTNLSDATVITMYLLPDVNLQLRPQLLQLAPGTRLVSHDWDMGDWPPDRTLTLNVPDKKIGLDKRSRVHLWWVPAPVAGVWCGPSGQTLQLEQRFQSVHGRWSAGAASDAAVGHVTGKSLTLQGLKSTLRLSWIGPGQMRQTGAAGDWIERGKGRSWQAADHTKGCSNKG